MKTRLYIMLLLFSGYTTLISGSEGPIDSILLLMNEYRYRQALDLINKEIEKKNNLKTLYYYKGNVLRELYSYNDAIKSYLAAYELDTTDNMVLINLGNTCKVNEDYSGSVYYFSKALSNDPANPYIALEIATSRYLNKQFDLAKKDFLMLYRNDTSNYYVITRLANCFNRLEKPDSALFFFEKAFVLNPGDFINLRNLCITCISKKDFKTGINKTEQFMARDSNNYLINSMNAYLYLQDKQYRQSIRKYSNCLDRNMKTFEVYKYLGIAYYRLKSFDTAKVYLEQAYLLDSLDVNNAEFLSSACLNSYYKELGIYYYEKYIELSGYDLAKYAEVYQKLYEACLSWARCPVDKLLSVAKTSYQLNPDKFHILYMLGYNYDTRKNDYESASEYYSRYLNECEKNGTGTDKIFMEQVGKRLEELRKVSN